MDHKMRIRNLGRGLLSVLSAFACLWVVTTDVHGQSRSTEEALSSLRQYSQERLSESPTVLESRLLFGLNENVPARGTATSVHANLQGLRVQVAVSDPMSGTVIGSGFWISSEGLVVTCWRNVSSNPDGIILIKGGTPAGEFIGKLVTQDIQKNLALIKVEPNPFAEAKGKVRAAPARLRAATPSPTSARVGDGVFLAVKRPKQSGFAAQAQPISEIRPVKELGDEVKILLSGVTKFGTSGEPVVNGSGQLVGMLEGAYPSMDRVLWGTTEVVIPVQAILSLVKSASAPSPQNK